MKKSINYEDEIQFCLGLVKEVHLNIFRFDQDAAYWLNLFAEIGGQKLKFLFVKIDRSIDVDFLPELQNFSLFYDPSQIKLN